MDEVIFFIGIIGLSLLAIIRLFMSVNLKENHIKNQNDYIKLQSAYIEDLGKLICDQHKEINGDDKWGDLVIKLNSIKERHE
jgi:hypothetical protein